MGSLGSPPRLTCSCLAAAALWLVAVSPVFGAEADLASRAQAVLSTSCLGCHGAAKMSGLDLRSRETALAGGTRGPAFAPGDPAGSLLLKAVRREGELKMPPGEQTLDAASIETLREWIAAGAEWPNAEDAPEPAWWSFRKPVRPEVPKGENGASFPNPIDAFVGAKLAEKGLKPNPPAEPRALIRRVYFDLTGLPPKPEDVDTFAANPSDAAYRALIERLLDSPQYGERWGRHWLDVVRYADTGGFETDVYFANAWRYRDYVIESFNRDKPYDQFIKEQVAADEIWPDNLDLDGSYLLPHDKKENLHKLIGTGLYTLGAFPVEITFYGDQYRSEWQSEAVDVTGAAFLGLTVGCARCHDHKFDPISQRDYYSMGALFAGSEEREIPIVSRMGIYEFTRYQTRWTIAEQIKAEIKRLDARARERHKTAAEAEGKPAGPRGYTPEERDQRETLLRRLGEAYLKAPEPVDKADVLAHTERVPDNYILGRGDFHQKREKVEPGFIAALGGKTEIKEPDGEFFIPRRRKALAEWLASPDHPLTARVMVNRIWQGHFGRGIVGTPNDFGRQGDRPTHPKLLDWLATEFVQRRWSVKAMHRLILTSDAYRRSSAPTEGNLKADPENRYLWRMSPQRLEAEELRDAVLAVSGRLNLKAGGPAVVPPLTQEETDGMRDASQWPVTSDPSEHTRRSVYLFVKRSYQLPMFKTFDAPDSALSCSRRDTSTVAPQALTLMNSRFMLDQAEAFAARLRKETGDDPGAWVDRGVHLAFGRTPTTEERARALEFLKSYDLRRLCLLWFNMSEFLYVD